MKSEDMMSELFDTFDRAHGEISKIYLGANADPDVRFFNSLDEADMNTLRDHYGDDAVEAFAKEIQKKVRSNAV